MIFIDGVFDPHRVFDSMNGAEIAGMPSPQGFD